MGTLILSSFEKALEIFSENNIPVDSIVSAKNNIGRLQVVTAVGLTGDLKGNIIFGAGYETAQRIVDTLFLASDITPQEKGFGDLQKATIGEFTNQIAGRALMNLAKADMDCNMSPPTVLTGNWVSPDLCCPAHEFTSRISGGFGEAILYVGLKKLQKNS